MKKLSKTILSIAAVSAVSAVMAASAMAMSASYDAGTVTLTDVASTGASQTLLILNSAEDTVTEAMIEQIDQTDDGSVFSTVTVGDLEDGTYYVRVGGTNGTIQTAEFVVGETSAETMQLYIGDVNIDESINSLDVGNILRYTNGATTRIGKAGTKYKKAGTEEIIIVGDANLDSSIGSLDVGNILRYSNGATTRVGSISSTPVEVESTPVE